MSVFPHCVSVITSTTVRHTTKQASLAWCPSDKVNGEINSKTKKHTYTE